MSVLKDLPDLIRLAMTRWKVKTQRNIILALLLSMRQLGFKLESKRSWLRYIWVSAPDGSFDHWFNLRGRAFAVGTILNKLGFWRLAGQLLSGTELVPGARRRVYLEKLSAASEHYYCSQPIFDLRQSHPENRMRVTFKWFCSYMGDVEYQVMGDTPVRSIEVHQASNHTLEYARTIHNYNGDPTSFERNVLSAQGGVSIHCTEDREYPKRWQPELYDAFVAHLHAMHEQAAVQMEDMYTRWQVPADQRAVMAPAFIPRPIFFNMQTQRYETESWFEERERAASVDGSISKGAIRTL
jgi:hypothetical protein